MNNYGLTYDTLKRLQRVMADARFKANETESISENRSDSKDSYAVHVDSDATVTANGYYSAKLYLYDSVDQEWSLADPPEVWALPLNEGSITLDKRYDGTLLGVADETGETSPTERLLYSIEVPDIPPAVTSAGAPENLLDNGGFCYQSHGSSVVFGSPGVLTADRWIGEAENSVTWTGETDPFSGACCYARFTAGGTGKFLVAQWLRSCPYKYYQGQLLQFQVAMRVSSERFMHPAIIKWQGTADAVPTTLVSNWATNLPTFVAGIEVQQVTYFVFDTFFAFSIPASVTLFDNVGVVIITDTQFTAGQTLDIAQAMLVPGSSVVEPKPRRPELEELAIAHYTTLGTPFN